jgi:uncharacterized protein (DUF1800 family)
LTAAQQNFAELHGFACHPKASWGALSEHRISASGQAHMNHAAAVAAHRFGLGEATLSAIQSDPQAWLLAQMGPADVARGEGLLNTDQAVAHVTAEAENRRLAKNPPPGMTAEQVLAGHYREVIAADVRSRFNTAAQTQRPFAERLVWFWANHFTVSLTKGSVRGLVGAFERDAIRPNIAGSFEQMLVAATTHPAMLRYLDNNQSAGPNSSLAQRAAKRAQSPSADMQEPRRVFGLNENLAREVLELHTLGAANGRADQVGGYRQGDVTAFASVLTGWRVGQQNDAANRFDPAWHEPGRKTVLGKTYETGPDALRAVLHDLAEHPATARFIATKLARHFIADEPPAPVIDRLTAAYQRSHGQLTEVYRELIRSPEAWTSPCVKLKTPEEFVVSTVRLLGLNARFEDRRNDRPNDRPNAGLMNNAAGIINTLGQRPHTAPSPAGWPDKVDDWLGPEAVWQRMEWATRVADRVGRTTDARALASASLGTQLSEATRLQIERAADGPQALALLLMSPEFQRR